MAIKPKSQKKNGLEIDLTGPQGNVFFLIATARSLAKELGKDPEKIADEMMSSDYENAVQVFDREFGEFVTLWR